MIDFTKKIKNSNKFRTPALTYIESGSYCSFPKGTSEYFNFWETGPIDALMVILQMMGTTSLGITIFI